MEVNEKGFTLAEIVTSLMIFGLLASFSIPIFLNLKQEVSDRLLEAEAHAFLQEKMERMVAEQQPVEMKGQEVKKSPSYQQRSYQLHWQIRKIPSGLWQIDVEVQWKKQSGQVRKIRLRTHRFIPLKTNGDLPILN
ncbi:type II secretion system protein [Thermoflavimicrobium dichotomicum]|uniref:Prepilin-type N-terminal cleavage/methylation domain-containing protein n=1 Tax=Thermoflavimicrobium dichotomicum TaxID=46223 RepID=A0A1I3NCW9_9BACL|nr:type II secretion system protein [Thermoflavimicrobium dichotomicum]SFJ07191.1 prepilin-type N-terminal cleavage/methylation domain-containing protein [Thermoflavimicrobium dichotomicum]